MLATRRARLESVILEELSQVIARELRDPRIPLMTITKVEVTEDAKQATLFISVLRAEMTDDEAHREKMDDCLEGLESASSFMRKHLAKVLQLRHIPALVFKEDRGLENSIRVGEILKKLDAEKTSKKQ
jgi:ribosome-binding factor A